MAQISSRIAFNTGEEDLIRRLFTFEEASYRTDNPNIAYSRISDKVGFAVCTKTADCKTKYYAKMAYAGDSNSEEQLQYAREIREKYYDKYKDYYGLQIIAGAENEISADYYPGCSDADQTADKDANNKNLFPLYLGVSGATSEPIPMRFSNGDAYTNYFALASDEKLLRIERNAMLSYLFECAKRGYKGEIVYCALPTSGADMGIDGLNDTKPIKKLISEHPWMENCIKVFETIPSVLNAILKAGNTYEKRKAAMFEMDSIDRSPKFLVFHKVSWVYSDIYSSKTKQNLQEKNKTDENIAAALSELFKSEGLDNPLAGEEFGFLKSVSVSKTQKDEDVFTGTAQEVKDSFRRLLTEGNKQNIFVLATAGTEETLRQTLGPDDRVAKKMLLSSTVYGNFNVKKNKDIAKDDATDCCFICPSNIKTRFYDYSEDGAKEWWAEIEKKYK